MRAPVVEILALKLTPILLYQIQNFWCVKAYPKSTLHNLTADNAKQKKGGKDMSAAPPIPLQLH